MFFLPNTWAGQKYQYLKHGGDNSVANKKMTLGQVVTSLARARVYVCVCVCYNTIVVYTIHHRKLYCMFILKENV